jgi:hypothetical protein
MTKVIVLFAFAVSAIGLGGCTGSGQASLVPKADSSHAISLHDNNGGGIPCGDCGDPPGGGGP